MGAVGAPVRDAPVGDLTWPLSRAARLWGDKPALADADRTETYAELQARVDALTAGLDRADVAPGARVGFLGANSLTHLECCIGVPAAGRIFVDLNFRLATRELQVIAADAEIELLIVSPDQLEVGRHLQQEVPSLRQLVLDGPGGGEDCPAFEELLEHPGLRAPAPTPESIAAISYTGGTTGRSKGVMLSHANLLANAKHNLITTGHDEQNRWLHVCPMFHVAGTANIFASTWAGATQLVLPRFDARVVIDTIRQAQITHVVLVPTMLGMLLDELDSEATGEGLPSLAHIQYAASPITPALQRRVLEAFDCDVVQLYGMTEAAPSVTRLSGLAHRQGIAGIEPWARRLRSVGVPIMGVQAEVRGPDGAELAPGEVGELWVRGPNIMAGYWGQPEISQAALADGWYHTGDAAQSDEGGYLFLVDRLKDMIITGGENVYSIEVEAVLADHPAVVEAAVFGIPDPRWGEAVHAVVVLRPGAEVSAAELTDHSRAALAGYKVPRSIDVTMTPLPKSGPGKVLKAALREPYWVGHDRRVS